MGSVLGMFGWVMVTLDGKWFGYVWASYGDSGWEVVLVLLSQ